MTDTPSATEAAELIRRGQLSSAELVDQCLRRIDALDDRLRAWVAVDRGHALSTAEHLDREAAEGSLRGPLHGVPVGIKDIIDVTGWPTKAGSPIRENHVAALDAPVVQALRHAGAVILGKTVTVEFACFDPSPSRNPWDPKLRHTPGGSSSGSAVAVAAGMIPAALGTQTGGSLVRPASYCGIASCKPTFGRVDRRGVVPVSLHLDHVGPMARTVADLRLLLSCLPRSLDFAPSSDIAWRQPDREKRGLLPPRLGLVDDLFHDEATPEVGEAFAAAVEKLRTAGAAFETIPLPGGFDEIDAMHTRIMACDAAAYHRPDFPARRDQYGPKIAGLLDEGLRTSGADYAAALAHRADMQARMAPVFDEVDALIVPATEAPAPDTLETTGSKRFQAPWSYLGVPVVSLPLVLSSDGLPLAVQLVGPYHTDDILLEIGAWAEAQFGFTSRAPLS